MGQKINPTGLRVGVIKDWESRWYAKNADFGDMLVEDYNLREWLLTKLAPAGVPKIEIERRKPCAYQYPLRKARHGNRPRWLRD